MKKVKTIVLRTAGTNCDKETAYAFQQAGSEADLVHINTLVSGKKKLANYHILAIPGGFTYGDDVASGKILANELRFKLKGQLSDFVDHGKLVIGICNGFQVLVKMGLLPRLSGKKDSPVESTLSLNDCGKFQAKWVHLKREDETGCVWTVGLPDIVYVPIAHAEGKFIPRNKSVLDTLKRNEQVVFRYCDSKGERRGFPYNPNGSVDDIAGITDPTGRILGMMPHPERHISYLQHPNWRRLSPNADNMGIGLKIFKNGVNYVKNHL
ncbi:MAG: phosphoribosylformylglycinamidine synthase I [Candidatus Omnitrophica bacterium]|nr:phosphoribosylformylglycinamidine synthase I [Candidatus Omnitrophota bacterium]